MLVVMVVYAEARPSYYPTRTLPLIPYRMAPWVVTQAASYSPCFRAADG